MEQAHLEDEGIHVLAVEAILRAGFCAEVQVWLHADSADALEALLVDLAVPHSADLRHAVDLDAHQLSARLRRQKFDAPACAYRQGCAEAPGIHLVHRLDVRRVLVHDLGADHAIERAPALLEDRLEVADRAVHLACHPALDELSAARVPTRLGGDPDHAAVRVRMGGRAGRLWAAAADHASGGWGHQSRVAMQSICPFAPFHRNAAPKLVRAGSGSWKRSP